MRHLSQSDKPESTGSIQPPIVYVRDDYNWTYTQLVRNAEHEALPTDAELNQLGSEGWELTGTVTHGANVYFYFKRLANDA